MRAATAGKRSGTLGRARRVAALLLIAAAWLTPVAGAQQEAVVAAVAARGDVELLRSLLRAGKDVNAAQGDGMTALHWASRRGESEVVEMLLYAGANVGAVTRLGGYTALHMAAATGVADAVRSLLSAGAAVDAVTTTGGSTALHFAAGAGDPDSIAALLDHGAHVDAREAARGQTPLMFAAASNRVAALEVLLQRGADPAATAAVIDIAARDGADAEARRQRDQALATLRAASDPAGGSRPRGADRSGQNPSTPGSGTPPPAPSRYEPNEEEPLSYADLVGRHGGLTALLHASREGHREAVIALLEGGAAIDQESAGDRTGPMLIAVINGHFDLALELLALGADPNRASDAGTTPLYAAINVHWAPKSRYPQPPASRQQRATYIDVMRALLTAGVDPDVRLTKHLWYMSYNFDLLRVDTKGATAFWRAAYATDVEAMRLLVAHGADPHLPTEKPPARFRRGGDREGPDPSGLPPVPVGGPAVYPIHAASGVGYGEGYAANSHRHVPGGWLPAVRYLVEELGADVNARDMNGYTPLHHAAARGDNELISYLAAQGADVTAVSRRGQTTADMANGPVQRIQPFPETVALLEQLGSKNNHNCVSC